MGRIESVGKEFNWTKSLSMEQWVEPLSTKAVTKWSADLGNGEGKRLEVTEIKSAWGS
jgi:hypothetical protein